MRYLAFDIECCNGKHICEFGYVITDENFREVEKCVLTINPESEFKLTGRQDSRDLRLCFDADVYCRSPLFTEYYDKIKSLLEASEQIIIGHAVSNDAGFLRTACKRYHLTPINFSFFDSQRCYSMFADIKDKISLERAEEGLKLQKPEHSHRSDDDALASLQLVQAMCQKLNVDLKRLTELYPNASGKSYNFQVSYTGDGLQEMMAVIDSEPDSLSNAMKLKCIKEFAKEVEPKGKIIAGFLNNKKCCFSREYEKEHTRQALILIQLLKNYGCEYNSKVSDNDYYIAMVDELENCPEPYTRYASAVQKKSSGGQIDIISISELCNMLNVTESELNSMPIPTIGKRKRSVGHMFSTGKFENTIGDLLEWQGISLSDTQN